MKAFLKNIISTIIGIVASTIILILLFIGIIYFVNTDKEITVKENTILKIDLANTSVVERTSENPFDGFNFSSEIKKAIELKTVLDNIEKAKTDKNITAIYLNSPFVNAGLSQIEEIRNKLLEFKRTGKPIISYSEVYSQSAYYLASIADNIYLNPEGVIELKGLSISQLFFKGLLEKLDIDMQIIRHGKFKSAVEPYSLKKMSNSNRQQMSLLLNSLADNIMDSIANQRGLTLSEIQEHANNLSLENARECLYLNYVDALLYQDQIEDSLVSISKGEKLRIISLKKYSSIKTEKGEISRNKIAIVYANGPINSGKGDERNIGSETTAKAIKQAREDKNVKAIVLRVNSGGGSALASDVILRETILTKESKKPIVVSMGNYAASGGYYISCAADRILASANTITGSIGVFGLFFTAEELLNDKIKLHFSNVKTNEFSDIGSVYRSLSQQEKSLLQVSVKNTYDNFINHVSNARKMTLEEVDKIGQGRVWTGARANKIGLIDSIGGLSEAIEIASELAQISDFQIEEFPKQKNGIEVFLEGIAQTKKIQNTNLEQILLDQTKDKMLNMQGIQALLPIKYHIE